MENNPPTKFVIYRGLKVKVYSIGWLAYLAERSCDTVRRWKRLGILPSPVLSSKKGKFRWYTCAELRGYSEIFKRANVRRRVKIEATNFRQNAQSFRVNLASAMKTDPEILGRVLTGDDTLKQAMCKTKELKWKAKVDKIIS